MKQPTLIVMSSSKSELTDLAERYGGTVSLAGILRWKLTIHTEMAPEQFDEFVERLQSGGFSLDAQWPAQWPR
jgi:hypothetical protein